MKPVKAWMLKRPNGELAYWTLSHTRKQCIGDRLFTTKATPAKDRWKCVRVEIREVEKS